MKNALHVGPESEALCAAFHAFAGDNAYTAVQLGNMIRASKLTTAVTLAGQIGIPKDNPDAAFIERKLTEAVGALNADGSRRLTLSNGQFSAAATS